MMAPQKIIFATGLLFLAGCTYEDVRQLGYFAVGNLHQYQCQRAMADGCKEASFDEYQRQRQEVTH